MHASKGILNLPTSSLHLCLLFQQIVRSGFTINSHLFQNYWVKIHHCENKVGWRFTKLICFFLDQDSLSNKENNKTIKRTFVRSRFTMLQILLGEDSPCPNMKYKLIHQFRNFYISRFDVETAWNLWRSLRRVSSRWPLTAALINMVAITRHVFINIFQTKHSSAAKFAIGYEKNIMSFLVIHKNRQNFGKKSCTHRLVAFKWIESFSSCECKQVVSDILGEIKACCKYIKYM